MSNDNFQERLDRIRAGSGQKAAPVLAPGTITGRRSQMHIGRMVVACLVLGISLQLIGLANRNYEAVKADHGPPAALGMGIGSFALLILAVILMFRAIRPVSGVVAGTYAANAPMAPVQTPVQTSPGARAFFSLLGLGLGALACFFMFVGNAAFQLSVAGQISVETSRAMATGCSVAAGLLAALALLIGFVGLFVRGLPMKRVPLLYPLGAVLLFASFQTFRIHPVDWPVFMAEFTRSFTNQIAE